MANEKNNNQNVSLGKTDVTGYVWWAPAGTALPTNSSTALDPAYKLAGFIGEDGVKNSTDTKTTSVVEMGGSTVLSEITSYAESYQFTLIEYLRADAAKIRYGADMVTGQDGSLTVKHAMPTSESIQVVFEVALTGSKKTRIVVPNATRSEFDDRQWHAGDPIGYDVTLNANPDSRIGGATSIEYIGVAASVSSPVAAD